MPIIFDRGICRDLGETISREWLVTNGLGGYASGTVAGVLTRRQHGLLVAVPPGSTIPHVLLAKMDEEVVFDQRTYYLETNEYRDGALNPAGFVHLEEFRLEEGFPIFTCYLGGMSGIALEKRIWLPWERNITCVQYRVYKTAQYNGSGHYRPGRTGPLSGSLGRPVENARSLTLTLLPFTTYRPYNQTRQGSHDQYFEVQAYQAEDSGQARETWHASQDARSFSGRLAGCTVRAAGTLPYHILAVSHSGNQVTFLPTGVWYWNFLHRQDKAMGLAATDDLYLPGVIRATLNTDEEDILTIIASTEDLSSLDLRPQEIQHLYAISIERRQQLFHCALYPRRFFGEGGEAAHTQHLRVLPLTTTSDPDAGGEDFLRLLLQAVDSFFVHYRSSGSEKMPALPALPSLLSSYYTMEHRIRDALIALPGLTLVSGRYADAQRLLHAVARTFRDGLLADRFPLPGRSLQDDDYGSVDTTLWFFYALDYYLRITRHYDLLETYYDDLRYALHTCMRGTINNIHMDHNDGLLYAGQPGKALTWMNASINGVPQTPRTGKAVEVHALCYHALALMHKWSQYMSRRGRAISSLSYYQELLKLCRSSFQERFWYAEGGYLYDVVDGPQGNDPSLRPNQLLALSLRHPILDSRYHQSVFDQVTRHLLTPWGLRTLSPQDSAYRGSQGKDDEARERALHQGSIWPWLIGPYIDALLIVGRHSPRQIAQSDRQLHQEYLWRKGLQLLEPFRDLLYGNFLGMCANTLDGDSPHHSGPEITSAVSIGELLRVYNLLAHMQVLQPDHALMC
ncbi:MAG: glycogen debranching enzyme N-terminal domain-containing protein [Ktedonobacteraceae bacterium]|nr:glycogen debranching enzyme N-terminal domain-containing protein [Ktedonobacteraceae bacterium]